LKSSLRFQQTEVQAYSCKPKSITDALRIGEQVFLLLADRRTKRLRIIAIIAAAIVKIFMASVRFTVTLDIFYKTKKNREEADFQSRLNVDRFTP
jgi:hypothetical protein